MAFLRPPKPPHARALSAIKVSQFSFHRFLHGPLYRSFLKDLYFVEEK